MNWQNLRVCELFRQSREKRAPSPPDSPHSLYKLLCQNLACAKDPAGCKGEHVGETFI